MRVTIGVALCLLGGTARADVLVRPGVAFTAAQLEGAIRARGGPDESRLDVEVSSPGPGRLALVMPTGTWEIEIGAASGDTAARVVALHVIELWAGTAATAVSAAVAASEGATAVKVSAPDAANAPVRVAGSQAPEPEEVRIVAPRGSSAIDAVTAPVRYRLAALGVGAHGFRARDFELVGGAIEMTRAGRWIAGAGVDWQRSLTMSHAPTTAEGLVRAHLRGGVAIGAAELVAGGFAGRVDVDSVNGTASRLVTGFEAAVRMALPVSAAWAIVLSAGGELYRERIEVRLAELRVGATPRTTLCGAIGLAWTGEPAR